MALAWIGLHWFELLQTGSIVFGLLATSHTIREDTRERKIENQFAMAAAHRELWTDFYQRPELHRIREIDVDLERNPPTMAESRFVLLLILHLRASFKARKAGMDFDDDALVADVRQFFRRPIPKVVWEEFKRYQDADFVDFVETSVDD